MTSTSTGEIKAALPMDFTAKPSDSSRWIKAMNAYFSINSSIYKNDEIKIALILSKMGTGKGVTFSTTWYDKMTSTNVKPEDKTLTQFMDNYEKNFCPFDIKEKAHRDISRQYQKPGKDEDSTPNDSF